MYAELHEDQPYHDGSFLVFGEKATPLTPFHVEDGLSIYLSEVDDNPDDDFLTNKFAQPARPSVAQQALDENPEAGERGHDGD